MAQEKPSDTNTVAANTDTAPKKTEVSSKPVAKKTVSKKKTAPKKATVKKVASKNTARKKTTAKKSQPKKTASNKTSSTTKKAGNFAGNNNHMMENMMKNGQVNFEKLTQDATEMGRENMEAMIQSGTVFAQGFENIMRTAMGFVQDTAEKQGEFMKQAMTTKTLNEFTEVQNKIAQANFDNFMTNTTKLTEMSVKTLNDSVEPINAQVTKGMQKATKMAA